MDGASSDQATQKKGTKGGTMNKTSKAKAAKTKGLGEVKDYQASDKDVLEAKNKNAAEVFVVAQNKMVTNAPLLAGYLGHNSTQELNEWLDDNVRDHFTIWLEWKEKTGFSVGLDKFPNIEQVLFHKNMNKLNGMVGFPKFLQLDDIGEVDWASLELEELDDKEKAYACFAWIVYRVVFAADGWKTIDREVPVKDAKVEQTCLPRRIAGYSPESWSRGFWMVKWLYKDGSRARTKDVKKRDIQKPAIRPVYLTWAHFQSEADHYRTKQMEQAKDTMKPIELLMARKKESDDEDAEGDITVRLDSKKFKASIENHLSQADRDAEKFMSSAKDPRPPMLPGQSAVVQGMIAGKVKIGHGKEECDRVRVESLRADTNIAALYAKMEETHRMVAGDKTGSKDAPDSEESEGFQQVAFAGSSMDSAEPVTEDRKTIDARMAGDLVRILEGAVNKHGHALPITREACEYVETEWRKLQIEQCGAPDIMIKIWQVLGAKFMSDQESNELRCSLIAASCGLGKTFQCLVFVVQEGRIRYTDSKKPEADRKYKLYYPTLIVAPANSVYVWMEERAKLCPRLKMWQFFQDRKQTALQHQESVIDPTDMKKWWRDNIDVHDPETAFTCIVTSYITWAQRMLVLQDGTHAFPSATFKEPGPFDEDEIADLESRLSESVKARRTEGKIRHRFPFMVFERKIFDECHYMRNPSTYLSQAAFVTPALFTHFVSATPLLNHIKDLVGYLYQIWDPKWGLRDHRGRPQDKPNIEWYDETFNPRHYRHKDAPEREAFNMLGEFYDKFDNGDLPRLWMLDPRLYRATGQKHKWNPKFAAKVVPVVLEMFMLRMNMNTVIDMPDNTRVNIGKSVPTPEIRTTMLEFDDELNPGEAEAYYRRVAFALKGPSKYRDEDEADTEVDLQEFINTDMQPTSTARYLSLATLDCQLARMTNIALKSQENITVSQQHWITHDFQDGGATMKYLATRESSILPIPQGQPALAVHLSGSSPKFRHIVKLIKESSPDRRFVIFFQYPMGQWACKVLLDALGIDNLSLTSNMTQTVRAETAARFQEANAPYKVLCATMGIAGESINLQKGVGDLVFADLPLSWGIFMQVIGRLIRLGQVETVIVHLLWINRSFDQCQLYKMAHKAVVDFAGEGGDATNDEVYEDAATQLRVFLGMKQCPSDPCWASQGLVEKDRYYSEQADEARPAEKQIHLEYASAKELGLSAKKGKPKAPAPKVFSVRNHGRKLRSSTRRKVASRERISSEDLADDEPLHLRTSAIEPGGEEDWAWPAEGEDGFYDDWPAEVPIAMRNQEIRSMREGSQWWTYKMDEAAVRLLSVSQQAEREKTIKASSPALVEYSRRTVPAPQRTWIHPFLRSVLAKHNHDFSAAYKQLRLGYKRGDLKPHPKAGPNVQSRARNPDPFGSNVGGGVEGLGEDGGENDESFGLGDSEEDFAMDTGGGAFEYEDFVSGEE